MNTRRAIMKLIGAAPVMGGAAAEKLTGMLGSPAVVLASAALGSTGGEAGAPLPGASAYKVGDLLGRQVDRLIKQMEDERYVRATIRRGELDADLVSMRSLSRATKERMQFERDQHDLALVQKARSMLWGHP